MLGYTGELQESAREWQRLCLEHGQALLRYSQVLAGIMAKAAEILGQKLYDLASRGEPPETLRTLYGLWIDSGEEAYAEASAQPEFIRAQAGLVNTLMAVKRHEQKMLDEISGVLNLPTRRELDTSHRRLHQLRSELERLRETLDESSIHALREEVAALRREVQALRNRDYPHASLGEKRIKARGAKSAGKF
jgi:class III poly(R)-hydroxyalkanoic acid synthase PhaE subunit